MATEARTRRNTCKHVRSQESFYSDTPLQDDQFHSGIFWCHLTNDGLGPDGMCAHAEECSPDRECFNE